MRGAEEVDAILMAYLLDREGAGSEPGGGDL
jgi:hypothetical protein